jgi:queuine/archaeosine tRNA-ribosyltransferase
MGILVNCCAGAELYVLPDKHVKAMLINVPDDACSESAVKSTIRMLKAAKTSLTMLDSGGYQLHVAEKESKKISFDETKPVIRNETEINLAPILVMRPAAILKPDIVTGLDFPIKTTSDPEERKMEFMSKLGFNVLWAIECSDLRKKLCPGVQFFLPIQCYDLDQFDQFINLIPGVEYDGFSMPVRNLSISELILFMVRFYQMGISQVHILGTSELFNIAVAAYMARHLFNWVSFDATTWRKWAECSRYMNPYNLLQERIAQNVIIDENIAMDCQCPFCNGKTFTFIKNLPETDRTALLRSHNWWVIEKATRDLYQNSGNVIELERCLRARGAKSEEIDELCKALSLADSLKNGDIRILQDLLK